MRYHWLQISIKNDIDLFNKISDLLGVKPTKLERLGKFKDKNDLWIYAVDTDDNAAYYDFINEFLNILEPNFSELAQLGIERNDITFWLLYEYDQQCGLEFHPQEMKRLGDSGIIFCIDCWQSDRSLID